MQIGTRNRSDLKSYFVENAIPTEGNFSEFIDAVLNQKDDGIVKAAGNPLAIEGEIDSTSEKKAIHFYDSFATDAPTWTVALNPRRDPANASTNKEGFSLSDSGGYSRLFIDKVTGNVGLGTVTPGDTLSVAGTGKFTGALDVGGALSVTGDGTILFFGSTGRQMINLWETRYGIGVQNRTIYFRTGENFAWYKGGIHSETEYDAGVADAEGDEGTVQMVIDETGNVGIGTIKPAHNLSVVGTGNFTGALSVTGDGTIGGDLLFGSTGRQMINLYGTRYGIGVQSRTIYFRTGYNFAWYREGIHSGTEFDAGGTESEGNQGTVQMVIDETGNVGIGTTTPEQTLDVNGNVQITGVIKQEDWKSPTLLNGWKNYSSVHEDSDHNPAGYFKDSMGIVHLRGVVTNGKSPSVLSLPAGYRPPGRELLAVLTGGGVGRVDIKSNGDVASYPTNPESWISLNGLTFRAA